MKTFRTTGRQLPFLNAVLALIISATAQGSEDEQTMHNIRITLGDQIVAISLDDSPASRDFLAQLPLNLDLEDYSATEKIAYLPKKLSTSEAPAGITPKVGDVTYYAPWGNLAIFYKDFSYSRGLIKLGQITSGLEHLRYPGAKQALIERD
ncbi:cyclophilin-like fold protein [Pseudomonas sp. SH1-B]